jgi:hypothetical protein
VRATSVFEKYYQCLGQNLCIEATLEESIFVSSNPHTSILCFFMRLTTSCCFRGLLSPLIFQLNIIIVLQGKGKPFHYDHAASGYEFGLHIG